MLRHKLSGVGAAMITPFTADGRVDYKALARMIDYVIEGGVDYIVALGTTAETPSLYIAERAVIAMFITKANEKDFRKAMQENTYPDRLHLTEYLAKDNTNYPINMLRNLAIDAVKTSHFWLADMDMWPSCCFSSDS